MLVPNDYDSWETLGARDLSPDGKWVAYQIARGNKMDTLHVAGIGNNKTYKLPYGTSLEFSPDSRWLRYTVSAPAPSNTKTGERGTSEMGLLNLMTGEVQRISNVVSACFAREGKYLAILIAIPGGRSALLLNDLHTATTRVIKHVTEFSFSGSGDHLLYGMTNEKGDTGTVVLLDPALRRSKVVAMDACAFNRFTWSATGNAFAFFVTRNESGSAAGNTSVFFSGNSYDSSSGKLFDPLKQPDFPVGMHISRQSALLIGNDLKTVFFDLQYIKNRTALPGEKVQANVELWHWNDPEILPRQKYLYEQGKENSFLAVWHTDGAFHQLGAPDIAASIMTADQQFVLMESAEKYKPSFKNDHKDYYLADVSNGKLIPVAQNMAGHMAGSSPAGKYILYFRDRNWWVYDIPARKERNITANIKTPFWKTTDDHAGIKPPFGYAGWTKNDEFIFLYDQYNIWKVSPSGDYAKQLTKAPGNEEIVFRYNNLDVSGMIIDEARPVYLLAFGKKTKKYGFYRWYQQNLDQLLFGDYFVNRLIKAKYADVFSYVKQDYNVSPEMYVTSDFKENKWVLYTNPQQKEYEWGKSELITYRTIEGNEMQAALFYPAGFEKGKKYPMIVFTAEQLSSNLHNYVAPSSTSAYNTTNFTSSGYFILWPDISYKINNAGISAAEHVIAATNQVLKTGMIDRNRLGIMGHSWGGYEALFTITQTEMFKAASAGAPITDLVSMYSSVYSYNGMPNQKIFETEQPRFDVPWYDNLNAYLENSPLFNARRIKTPVLMAFGDKDGAVDWHQGIEMYSTLRRMRKPCFMLVYPGELHGLVAKENQVDYQRRQKEFFDHYLKGAEAAPWIIKGIRFSR